MSWVPIGHSEIVFIYASALSKRDSSITFGQNAQGRIAQGHMMNRLTCRPVLGEGTCGNTGLR